MKNLFFCLFSSPFWLFSQAVQFTSACAPQPFCFNQNACGAGKLEFTATATGGCSALSFSWDLDLGANGSVDKEGFGQSISEAVANAGPHKVKFLVKDNCGGAANCTITFSGKDCQPPSVLIGGGLSQSLQFPTCEAVIDPKIFVNSATDNCTPSNQIQLAIRRAGTGTGFPTTPTLTVGACEAGTVVIEIWAKDAAGNASQSNSYVLVQAGAGGCECPRDTVVFAGKMTTLDGFGAVPLLFWPTISGGTAGYPGVISGFQIDSTTGVYAFKAIGRISPNPYTVRIEPKKILGTTNGVSAYDLVLISKQILGSGPFDSVYKMAAGDSNLDGNVSTADVVELRKIIFGIVQDFPTNTSWRFVEAIADPSDKTQLPNLKEKKTIQFTMQQNQNVPDFLNLDFKAIKIGDLNGSADPRN